MAGLLTSTVAACLAISGGVHVVVYLLNATWWRLLVGLTVERISFGAGFHLAAAGAGAGLTLFVLTERRAVLRRSRLGV